MIVMYRKYVIGSFYQFYDFSWGSIYRQLDMILNIQNVQYRDAQP